jgi:hypothetical protein
MDFHQWVRSRHDEFQRNVATAIGTLLQQKHLYQSVLIPATDTYVSIKDKKRVEERMPTVTAAIRNAWSLEPVSSRDVEACHFTPPDVKLFCVTCDRLEPFNLVSAADVFRPLQAGAFQVKGETQQAFLLAYKCQSCKGTPELFLIRRRGLKLTNEGRSPIEHVDVPSFIPRQVKRFLGGAIVAHQSGQTLAGVFLLRTLIEQWARSATGSKKEQADQVLADYMATLPDDFTTRFPSMRALYGELSVEIHAATGTSELFAKAMEQVIQHFDVRRTFKLDEVAPGPQPKG